MNRKLIPETSMRARTYNAAIMYLEAYAKYKGTVTTAVGKANIRRATRKRLGLAPLTGPARLADLVNTGTVMGRHGLELDGYQYSHTNHRVVNISAENAKKCQAFVENFRKPRPQVVVV